MADSFIWFTLVGSDKALYNGESMKVSRTGLFDVLDMKKKIKQEVQSYKSDDIVIDSAVKKDLKSSAPPTVLENNQELDKVLPKPKQTKDPGASENPVIVVVNEHGGAKRTLTDATESEAKKQKLEGGL